MFKNLIKEIKVVKWPTKKTVIKDCVITLLGSSAVMLGVTIINFLSKTLMNLIF